MVGIAQLNLWIFKYTSALLASLIAKDWICIVSDSCKLCEREIIYVTAGVRDVMPHLFLLSTALNRLYLSFPLFFSTYRIASLCIYTYCAHFSRMASWASSSMKYNVMFSPLPSCWHLCWSGAREGWELSERSFALVILRDHWNNCNSLVKWLCLQDIYTGRCNFQSILRGRFPPKILSSCLKLALSLKNEKLRVMVGFSVNKESNIIALGKPENVISCVLQ